MEAKKSYEQLLTEIQRLQEQLNDANETLEAIRAGQVDALVVKNGKGHQLYTLQSADQAYRVFIEKMSEGAVTINKEGFILYSNSRFAEMVRLSLEKVIGVAFETFIADESRPKYQQITQTGWEKDCKEELVIRDKYDKKTCCLFSCSSIAMNGGNSLSLIVTDLTIQKENQKQLILQNEKLALAQNLKDRQNDELEATVRERTRDLLISREHFKSLADHIVQMAWTYLPNGDV
ncbi:MAG: PAS domain S-box protein, partial [Mucilaginibacter sp.]